MLPKLIGENPRAQLGFVSFGALWPGKVREPKQPQSAATQSDDGSRSGRLGSYLWKWRDTPLPLMHFGGVRLAAPTS